MSSIRRNNKLYELKAASGHSRLRAARFARRARRPNCGPPARATSPPVDAAGRDGMRVVEPGAAPHAVRARRSHPRSRAGTRRLDRRRLPHARRRRRIAVLPRYRTRPGRRARRLARNDATGVDRHRPVRTSVNASVSERQQRASRGARWLGAQPDAVHPTEASPAVANDSYGRGLLGPRVRDGTAAAAIGVPLPTSTGMSLRSCRTLPAPPARPPAQQRWPARSAARRRSRARAVRRAPPPTCPTDLADPWRSSQGERQAQSRCSARSRPARRRAGAGRSRTCPRGRARGSMITIAQSDSPHSSPRTGLRSQFS